MKYLLTIAALIAAGTANAAPICGAGTYNTYTAVGFECEIDGALFSNFSYPATPNGGDLAEADITVTPLSGPNSVGFRFTANFSSTGTVNGPGNFEGMIAEQYRFFFDVSLPGGLITDARTNITGGSVSSPNVQKPSSYLVALLIANDAALASVGSNTPGQTATQALNTARTNINVDTFVQLTGGTSIGSTPPFGVGEFDSFDNIFLYELNEVPEPGSAGLLLIALAAGGALQRLRTS
jgi:hypothetical protein